VRRVGSVPAPASGGHLATLVSLVAVTLSSALLICVNLFGRPRVLVPPRLRDVPAERD